MANRGTQIDDLLYQALDTERGGIEIHRTALACAVGADLRGTFRANLERTERHERVLRGVFEVFGLDPEASFPGREVTRACSREKVDAMWLAQDTCGPVAARISAAECVSLTHTKHQLNWMLHARVAVSMPGVEGEALRDAVAAVGIDLRPRARVLRAPLVDVEPEIAAA